MNVIFTNDSGGKETGYTVFYFCNNCGEIFPAFYLVKVMAADKVKCAYCESEDTIKDHVRKNHD